LKTVTPAFEEALKQPGTVVRRRIYYKRRKWNQTTLVYEWETNWTEITEDKVVAADPCTWQLDTAQLNVFKVSNLTLTFENLANQWNPENPQGRFGKDAASPFYGYEFYFTKFQICAGLEYGPGTVETVPIFVGVATEYNINTQTGAIQITVAGEEQILLNADAEQVSTTYTNEIIGTGNSANKDFYTSQNAVGIIKEISDNGITRRPGADYSVGQLNDPNFPAKISFVNAPLTGHTLRATYLVWKTNMKFEDLVRLLLTQAGIPSGNQLVQPVIFPGNIVNRHTWQNETDWNTGTHTLTTADYVANALTFARTPRWNSDIAYWTLSLFPSVPPWNNIFRNITGGISLYGKVGEGMFYIENYHGAVGTWNVTYQTGPHVTYIWAFEFQFMQETLNLPLNYNNRGRRRGYTVWVNYDPYSTGGIAIGLTRHTTGGGGTLLGKYVYSSLSQVGGQHTITVKRTANGNFSVWHDGVLRISATDTTVTVANYMGWWVLCGISNTSFPDEDCFVLYDANFTAALSPDGTGTWQSASVDFGATPTAWSPVQTSEILNGGTTTYYTRSSANNSTWDAWLQVPPSMEIQSTLRRYLQVQIVIFMQDGDPAIYLVSVGSITSSTVITIANFTGLTCYDAIVSLASFANYEVGFDAYENFFFRTKSSGTTPQITISSSDYIDRVVSLSSGYDRVYSIVRAVYGEYMKEIQDDGKTPLSPLARITKTRLEINGGDILIPADADVASGVAGTFFTYYRLPHRRVKLYGKLLPQLDLSDIVQANVWDVFGPSPNWYFGDQSQTLNPSGVTPLTLYGDSQQTLFNFLGKVVGMRMDTNTWTSEIDLEEILT
jgi:hypothetical protein